MFMTINNYWIYRSELYFKIVEYLICQALTFEISLILKKIFNFLEWLLRYQLLQKYSTSGKVIYSFIKYVNTRRLQLFGVKN